MGKWISRCKHVNEIGYLFICKLRQKAWITHRASSITKSRRKKKRKLVIQLTRMTLLWKRQKKKCQCKNRIGEDIDKKSTTHKRIEQAVQWRTSVALNTHTLKGLGSVDIVNRLISEIQVVMKKIFLEVRYLKCATGITKLSLT